MVKSKIGIDQTFERIVDELSQEEDKLRKRLAEIDAERTAIKADLARIAQVRRSVQKKSGASNGATATGTGLKKREVLEVLEQTLQAGPATTTELKTRAEELARNQGRSIRGITLQVTRALSDSRFKQVGEKYALAASKG